MTEYMIAVKDVNGEIIRNLRFSGEDRGEVHYDVTETLMQDQEYDHAELKPGESLTITRLS
jgi:hypothetical protein